MANASAQAHRLQGMRILSVLAVTGASLPLAFAEPAVGRSEPPLAEPEPQLAQPEPAPDLAAETDAAASNPYSDVSDEELGALAASFHDLEEHERGWFLTEVRKRMSARGERPRIPVRDRGRFGDGRKAGVLVREVGLEEGNSAPATSDEPGVYGTGPERSTPSGRDSISGRSRQAQEPPPLPRD